jgi:large subunit ribosomal protein L24
MPKLKIKTGDKVKVHTGKSKGTIGEVLKVFPKDSKILVAGANEVTKHQKPSRSDQGGVKIKAMPIHISNVAFYEESTGKTTKIGYKLLESGEKKRFSKTSGEILG